MNKSEKLAATFAKKDVEIIARETLYRGFFSLDLYRFRHRLFNGEMSGEVRREIFERGHAAVLLPYDPVRDEVVLIEQIRIAAWDTSKTPWLLEMIAGMIEEGESVEDVARREAVEEARPCRGPNQTGSELFSQPRRHQRKVVYFSRRSGCHSGQRYSWLGGRKRRYSCSCG